LTGRRRSPLRTCMGYSVKTKRDAKFGNLRKGRKMSHSTNCIEQRII